MEAHDGEPGRSNGKVRSLINLFETYIPESDKNSSRSLSELRRDELRESDKGSSPEFSAIPTLDADELADGVAPVVEGSPLAAALSDTSTSYSDLKEHREKSKPSNITAPTFVVEPATESVSDVSDESSIASISMAAAGEAADLITDCAAVSLHISTHMGAHQSARPTPSKSQAMLAGSPISRAFHATLPALHARSLRPTSSHDDEYKTTPVRPPSLLSAQWRALNTLLMTCRKFIATPVSNRKLMLASFVLVVWVFAFFSLYRIKS